MHAQLAAALAEHRTPTHVGKRAVHDRMQPLDDLVADIQYQVIKHHQLLDRALRVEHDPAYDGFVERVRQTIDAMEREAKIVEKGMRQLAQTFTQLERYSAEWDADIARYEASRVPTPAPDPDATESTVAK